MTSRTYIIIILCDFYTQNNTFTNLLETKNKLFCSFETGLVQNGLKQKHGKYLIHTQFILVSSSWDENELVSRAWDKNELRPWDHFELSEVAWDGFQLVAREQIYFDSHTVHFGLKCLRRKWISLKGLRRKWISIKSLRPKWITDSHTVHLGLKLLRPLSTKEMVSWDRFELVSRKRFFLIHTQFILVSRAWDQNELSPWDQNELCVNQALRLHKRH